MSGFVDEDRTYVLNHEGGHGTGPGHIPSGTEVTVAGVWDHAFPGIGGNGGVLFTWNDGLRNAHLPTDQFLMMFTAKETNDGADASK